MIPRYDVTPYTDPVWGFAFARFDWTPHRGESRWSVGNLVTEVRGELRLLGPQVSHAAAALGVPLRVLTGGVGSGWVRWRVDRQLRARPEAVVRCPGGRLTIRLLTLDEVAGLAGGPVEEGPW